MNEKKFELLLTLCYRCQRRVDWLENQSGFRNECQQTIGGVCSCYGFIPTLPIALKPTDPKDRRPRFAGPMFSQRESGVELDKEMFKLHAQKTRHGIILYYVPRREK